MNLENALYIVATPIGNLQDLTERAKLVLEKVDLIACEDSRVTGKLMVHLGLKKSLFSCYSHNEAGRALQLIKFLQEGKSIAYVSDAGTPGISDPGNLLVAEVQKAGFKIIPIPGASSLTVLLSVCGFNLAKGFSFVGFLPRTESKLKKILEFYFNNKAKSVLVAFESPYRIKKTLQIIAQAYPEANICLGRELTKRYEQILRGNIQNILKQNWPEKGEFVLALTLQTL